MEQVAVAGMNFKAIEPCPVSPHSSLTICIDNAPEFGNIQRLRGRKFTVGDSGRTNAFTLRRRFSACVGELNPDLGAAVVGETCKAAQSFDLSVCPKTQVLTADAPAWFDRHDFCHDQAYAAQNTCAVVNEMPFSY
ncbi:hypothetical protein StoSoilB20_18890 [Arthrobacter sp. StoSoilB20]|nr:hypothetical protein StoSoilB20_18890 [Arthrobacter sp. StoSoilB20]